MDETMPATYPSISPGRRRLSVSVASAPQPMPVHTCRNLTQGSVPRILWFLGWPQITEGVVGILDQITDLIWVGRLGFHLLAGLGVVQTCIMLVITARIGLEIGMRTMIARVVGARRMSVGNHILLQAISVTVLFGVAVITSEWLL